MDAKIYQRFLLIKISKKFIQIGSSIEYGKLRSPSAKNTNNKNFSIYGNAKLLSTNLFPANLCKKFNFPVTVLRFYLVYGPHQDINR